MMTNKSCDTCEWFVKIKDLKGWQGRLGICEYEDGSLSEVITNCDDYKSKKYKRTKTKIIEDTLINGGKYE
jgi:hypothetical protein